MNNQKNKIRYAVFAAWLILCESQYVYAASDLESTLRDILKTLLSLAPIIFGVGFLWVGFRVAIANGPQDKEQALKAAYYLVIAAVISAASAGLVNLMFSFG